MDKAAVIQIARQYADLIRQQLPVRKVILFGSQASGTAGQHSDIDIAVVMRNLGEDFLDMAGELYQLRSEININIEPKLFDEDHDRSGFLENIMKTGVLIYDAEREAA